jgi:hypothetical protein
MSIMREAGFEVHKDAKNAAVCPRYEHELNLSHSKVGTVKAVNSAMGIRPIVTHFIFLMPHLNGNLCYTTQFK